MLQLSRNQCPISDFYVCINKCPIIINACFKKQIIFKGQKIKVLIKKLKTYSYENIFLKI